MGDIELLLLQKPRLRKLSVLHFSFELDNDSIITFQLHTFVEKIKNIKNTGKMEKTHKLQRFAPDFWDGWNFPNLFGDSLMLRAGVENENCWNWMKSKNVKRNSKSYFATNWTPQATLMIIDQMTIFAFQPLCLSPPNQGAVDT